MNRILDILKENNPYIAIYDLFKSGELKNIFPELYNLYTEDRGYKNNFIHTLGVLENVCEFNNDFKLKIVALLHDIGKTQTKKNSPNGWTFHNHESVGANMSTNILDKWDVSDYLKNYVYRMVYYHGRTKLHRDITDSAIRRLDNEVGQDIIFDLIDFCKCDITTKFQNKRQRIHDSLDVIKQRIIEVRKMDEDSKWKSPLTGFIIMDLLGIEQGKLIGDIKKELDPKLKSGEIDLDYAINYIKKLYKK